MSKTKNPVGRPPIAKEDQLSEIVVFRVTPGELASLTAAAKKEGCSLTVLIREALKSFKVI